MLNKDMKYYVYHLINPLTNEPFYIGKGKNDRAQSHLWNNSKTVNERKDVIIKEIRSNNLEPLIKKVAFFDNEKDAYIFEESQILFYGRKDIDENGILTNLTLYSRPPSQKGKKRKFTKEHCEKISKSLKGKPKKYKVWNFNKSKHNDKRIAKMAKSRSLTGNKHQIGVSRTSETKKKISDALKGKSITELHDKETSDNIRKKMSEKKKGRTWEEIYGVEGAKKRRDAMKKKKSKI